MIYLALYVDDGLVLCKSMETIKRFLRKFGQVFEIKVSEPNYFVGIEVERDRTRKLLKIHQKTYLEKLIEKFGMIDTKTLSIPVDPNAHLSNEMSPKIDSERRQMDVVPYSALIGSLQFAANVTRLDIAFGVNLLSRYLKNPGHEHWQAAKRILKYLKATVNEGIIYGGKATSWEPICYSDADFAGDEDERRSTSGSVVILCGGPVAWLSRRQKTVALSTAEAELIAATLATQEALWILKLMASIREVNEEELKPIQLNCDNQATIALTKNPVFHQRTKHIGKDYWFVRKAAEMGKLVIEYCPTEWQLADILTKGLPRPRFWILKGKLSMNSDISVGVL